MGAALGTRLDVVHIEPEGVPAARDLTHLLVSQQHLAPNGGRDRLSGAWRRGHLARRGPVGQVDLLGIAAGGLERCGVYLDRIGTRGLEGAFAMLALEHRDLIVGAPEGLGVSVASRGAQRSAGQE
jgi:hypothetical protein